MTDFKFETDKGFAENADEFLEHVKTIDEDLAAILQDNWSDLLQIARGGANDSNARVQFNSEIVSRLDALLLANSEQEEQ